MTRRIVPRQLATLTGLRGIAAFAIVFYHIRGSMAGFAPDGLIALLAQGYLAVDLFFVLSGFVLWLTYGSEFRDHGRAAVMPFIVRRAARIFPLHLAIMFAMLAFVAMLQFVQVASGRQYPLREFPVHLLLVHNWGLTDRLSWNDPSWSISAEWAAYLLLAVAGGWVAQFKTGAWRFTALVLGIAALLGLWFAFSGRTNIGTDIPETGVVRCLAEFVIGVLLCQWWTAMGARTGLIWATAAGLVATGTALIVSGVSQPAGVPLVMAAVVIVALEASMAPQPLLGGRIAQWLGTISYAIYLSHFFLWIMFKLLFVVNISAVSPVAIAAYVGLTLLTSHLLHRHVELPGRRLFQRVGDQLLARTWHVMPRR